MTGEGLAAPGEEAGVPAAPGTDLQPAAGDLDAPASADDPETGDAAPATPPAVPLRAPRNTLAGRVWVGLIVAVIVLILLIIFIAENSEKVKINFVGLHAHFALGLALLVAAIAGAIITLLVGTTRIIQLRREARRQHKRSRQLADHPEA